MARTYDCVAVGECLIDFVNTPSGAKLLLEGNPGGAPVNLLAMITRLGFSTAMITKVGKDAFGSFLKDQIEKAGIETEYVICDKAPTTLAIVTLDEKGDRSFSFYRSGTADVSLRQSEIPLAAIRQAKIFHFGSVSLTDEPARTATLFAAEYAYRNGVTVSYDPNLRPPLWDDLKRAKKEILNAMQFAHIVKVSQEELEFLTEETDLSAGILSLWEKYPLRLLAVTMGPDGCVCKTASGTFRAATFDTECIDTTGSGDAFLGAALGWLLKNDAVNRELTPDEVYSMMDFANAAGSLAATKRGAIPAMPGEKEIRRCIARVPRVPDKRKERT